MILFFSVFVGVLAAIGVMRWHDRRRAAAAMLVVEYIARAKKWMEWGVPPSVAIKLAAEEYRALVLHDDAAGGRLAEVLTSRITPEIGGLWQQEWQEWKSGRNYKTEDSPEGRALWAKVLLRRKEIEAEELGAVGIGLLTDNRTDIP